MTSSYPIIDDNAEEVREALELEREAEKRRYRRLRAFVEAAWPIVEPDREFASNWHIDHLCVLLEAITRGKIKRCIINVPPGTMKSLLVSVFWPAWEWTQFPSLRYLTASYGSHLTLRDNARFQNIVTSPWYQELWPMEFDKLGKERIDTARRGWRIATSVNGVGTGEHPDRIIIDDPTTADQARSDTERESANMWFDRTISSRGVTRNTRIVVIMQRLHVRDMTGHLLAKGGDWYHVCFPMEYRTKEVNAETKEVTYTPSPLDPRRKKGELMWPSLYTPQIVTTLKLDLGPYGAAGQLQQSPSPEGGGLFQRVWAKFVDIAPRGLNVVRGWDTAATEGGGDWTVGVKIGELNGDYYVLDVVRKQLSPDGVDKLILSTAEMDGLECAQREEKEGGSAGKAVINARLKLLRRFDYKEVQVSGDKVTRSKPFRSQFEGGHVYLVRAPWNETYLSELEYFPVGNHDDQVDGSSCAYNSLVAEPEAQSLTWGDARTFKATG